MDPQVQRQLMIWGGFVPAGITTILMLIFWSIHTRRAIWRESAVSEDTSKKLPLGPLWIFPILIAGAMVGAVSAQFSSIPWWPADNSYRLAHAFVGIGIIAAVESILRLPALVAFFVRATIYAAVFWMLAEGYSDNTDIFKDTWTFAGWWGAGALGAATIATIIDQHAETRPGWVDSLSWLFVFAGMMPTLFFNGNATGSQILPGTLAVLGPTLVVGLICKPLKIWKGASTILVGVVLVVSISSMVHSELRSVPAMILLIGAVLTNTIKLNPNSSSIAHLVTRLTIAAFLLGGAAALSYHEHDLVKNPTLEEGEYDPYADYLDE